jgi:DNA polymerase-3 subunit delta'
MRCGQVPRFLSLTAAEGGWRIVLVEQMEAMNAEAQNALLKTLEEPPPRALLLLTTAAPDRLLPTIRSRCRRIDLFPLPPNPQMDQAAVPVAA